MKKIIKEKYVCEVFSFLFAIMFYSRFVSNQKLRTTMASDCKIRLSKAQKKPQPDGKPCHLRVYWLNV